MPSRACISLHVAPVSLFMAVVKSPSDARSAARTDDSSKPISTSRAKSSCGASITAIDAVCDADDDGSVMN